ncbi:cytochrome P450 [Amycolatopsis sp. K13G38]|uniref:Cytochrome P450 n=1 Tax=Amycolatopsis acididurans TaxID=2724524 RepID=A0ABX1JAE8_9PSEU|nr:cytochrome P450 [Amycolatopsis acididurans]NKQ56748.1 cytochrome P450 [Amycolatopsis acididurans]
MTTTLDNVPQHLRVDFDIYDPGLCAPADQVNERVAELSAIGPLVYSERYGGHWIVTRYQEIHDVLRDPATFSSFPNNLIEHGAGKFLPLEVDPPEHTAYRHALQPLFNPNRMKALAPRIRAIVNELIDGFAARGEAEYISEFAHEMPARVFLALMGWPLEDAPMFTEMTDITLQGKPGLSEEENVKVRAEAAQQLFGYYANVIADRRSRPDADDITKAIIDTPVEFEDGKRLLTDEELSNMFFLLLIAGLHTVQGSLAWGVMHLSDHPEKRQELVDDPDIIPTAVEEILRIEAAVSPGRRVTKDVELGGVSLHEGDQLLLVLAGANRDSAEFEDPGVLDLHRTPNRHLSFGSGPHRCLGSHLARVELTIAFEELYRRLPDLRVDRDKPSVSHPSQVRGVAALPVTFTPES